MSESSKRFALDDDVTTSLQRRLLSFSGIFVPLAAWFVITKSGVINAVFLPGPIQTFRALIALLTPSFFEQEILPSLLRIGSGFLVSVAVAFPLGVLCGQSPAVRNLVQPLFGFSRFLPVAALVPLCILWFGINDLQKIAVVTIGVVFQLTLLFAADCASVPKELVESGLTFGLSRAAIIWRIVLPWSLPAIWEDLRIASGWAWSYLVLAELVAGDRGIGYFIIQSQRYLQTDHVFAGILLVGLFGLSTDLFFQIAAARLFRWV